MTSTDIPGDGQVRGYRYYSGAILRAGVCGCGRVQMADHLREYDADLLACDCQRARTTRFHSYLEHVQSSLLRPPLLPSNEY